MGFIDYMKLTDLLNERGLTYYSLRKNKIVGTATIKKLQRNKGDIDTRTIANICEYLKCQPGDFLEYCDEKRYPEYVENEDGSFSRNPIVIELENKEKYQEKLEKAIEEVVYPQYGDWCKEIVIQFIKNQGISDSEEFIKNKVFNPESSLYHNENYNIEYNPENILGNINYNEYYNQSLFYFLQDEFSGSYDKKLFDLNPNILADDNNRIDILTDIRGEGDVQDWELLEMALDEIGIDGLKKIILEISEE